MTYDRITYAGQFQAVLSRLLMASAVNDEPVGECQTKLRRFMATACPFLVPNLQCKANAEENAEKIQTAEKHWDFWQNYSTNKGNSGCECIYTVTNMQFELEFIQDYVTGSQIFHDSMGDMDRP